VGGDKARWWQAGLTGLRGLGIAIGVLVLLAASLVAWYLTDRGTRAIPGPLGDLTRSALGVDQNPFPLQPAPSGRYGTEGVETALRQGLEQQQNSDSRPEVRNAVLDDVACKEVQVPPGAKSDQRFTCDVSWRGFSKPAAVVLDIRDGQVVAATTLPPGPNAAGNGGQPAPCTAEEKADILRMVSFTKEASTANQRMTKLAASKPGGQWFDRLFLDVQASRLANILAVERLRGYEAQTASGQQLKKAILAASGGVVAADTRFLGKARTTEQWIRPKTWTRSFETWGAAIGREQDGFATFVSHPPCT
jgi:hypothetical protein